MSERVEVDSVGEVLVLDQPPICIEIKNSLCLCFNAYSTHVKVKSNQDTFLCQYHIKRPITFIYRNGNPNWN